jgi:putative nucleotidyltransferase with HDIG domain
MTSTPHIELSPATASTVEALAAAGLNTIIVGGAVRDALLGTSSPDLDLVTDGTPAQVRSALQGRPGVRGIYGLSERFMTVGVALDDRTVLEITTVRAEEGSLTQRFAADAALRDFTINAMGIDLATGELLDPTGGREDLADGILRAPGDPVARFADDPIRILRAARFVAQLGFVLDRATEKAMAGIASRFATVAAERIRDELTKLLVAAHPAEGLAVLRSCGGLAVALPGVAALDGLTQPDFHDLDALTHTFETVAASPPTRVLRWAALLHDTGKAPTRTVDPDGRIHFVGHAAESARIAENICTRLRFSNDDRVAIVHLVAEHMRLGELHDDNPRAVDRAVRKLDLRLGPAVDAPPLVSAEDALDLTLADFSATAHRAEAEEVRGRLSRAIAESRARGSHTALTSPVTGGELMEAFGLEEGPAVGMAMHAIVSAIDAGELAPDDRSGALKVARSALSGND